MPEAPAKAHSRRCFPGVYHYNVTAAEKVHLTSKPVPLLVDLLQVTPEDGTILDPFMGGGRLLWPAERLAEGSSGWSCRPSISS